MAAQSTAINFLFLWSNKNGDSYTLTLQRSS